MRNRKIKKIGIFFSLIILFSINNPSLGESWWTVYFTTPESNLTNKLAEDDPENALVKNINNTDKSFYGAFFDIESKPIVSALKKAHERGIDVRLVVEKDYYIKRPEIKELEKAGIGIVHDTRNSLMHNKFAVIDKKILWTGSYNLTRNDAYKNNNNAIEIHSAEAASIYLDEFNEMYQYKIFGNRKEYSVFPMFKKKYYVKIDDTNINIYFSPEDNIERIILKRIKKAKESIYFMAFSFTNDKIADEMIRLFKKGVKVSGLFEKIGSGSRYSQYTKMKLEGIPVKLDKNKYRMHHKVIIIDKMQVITGSYNLSKGANTKNDENIVIIENKDIAQKFFNEFFKLF